MQIGAQKNPYEDLLPTSTGGLDQTPTITAPTVPGGPSTLSTPQTATGEQTPAPANDDIMSHLSAFTSSSSPVVQQARTRGLQQANQRGLLNSSMGVQAAESALYDVALPAASQMAAQGHQTKIADKNIAAYDREKAASLAAAYQNTYAQMFSAIASNANLPADVRNSYMAHLGAMRDSNMGLLEQMYGISLEWDTPEVPTSGGDTIYRG